MPLSPYFLCIIMTTFDILVCREVCNHHLNCDEPGLMTAQRTSQCVRQFPVLTVMDVSLAHTLGLKEQRESCP